MTVEEIVAKKLKSAKNGKKIIQKILTKLPPNTAIMLFPEQDSPDNYYGLLYLDDFLRNFHYEKVWIITSLKLFEKVTPVLVDSDYKIINLLQTDIDSIIDIFSLTTINSHFWVASLTIPKGRKVKGLIGVKSLTYEEVFVVGVYKLVYDKFTSKKPIYLGEDKEILDFFNLSVGKTYEE